MLSITRAWLSAGGWTCLSPPNLPTTRSVSLSFATGNSTFRDGELAQAAAQEVAAVIAHNWESETDGDLLRFARLETTRAEHILYATQLAPGMLLALVLGGAMNIFAYWFSDAMVLRMYNAQEVDAASAPQFYDVKPVPHGAVSIGGDRGDDTGYLIRGDLRVYDDVGHAVAHQLLYHYESKARADELAAEWVNDDIVVIRLKPTKITKLG